MTEIGCHHFFDRWDSLHLLRSWLVEWSPLFPLFPGLSCIPVDPCFVDSYETTQKLFRILPKQHKTLLWSGRTLELPVSTELTLHPFTPTAFLCSIFYERYNPCGFLRYLLPQSSRTWTWLIKNTHAPTFKLARLIFDGMSLAISNFACDGGAKGLITSRTLLVYMGRCMDECVPQHVVVC